MASRPCTVLTLRWRLLARLPSRAMSLLAPLTLRCQLLTRSLTLRCQLKTRLPPRATRSEGLQEGTEHPLLRLADDSDVLATVCKHWWKQHGLAAEDLKPAGADTGLEELRFKQLQEVEAVKRVFSRRNRPLDPAVLERALIMPVHRATGAGVNLKAGASNLPSNPFFKAPKKGKKTKRKSKAKAGRRASSRSPGPPKRR
mmetsp:Transcript_126913/g.320607  ORF Transcript_126913/g.320607 Transcript_126913/m.320607 type:complete len:200 (-) Transcript_126913:188-787(-)